MKKPELNHFQLHFNYEANAGYCLINIESSEAFKEGHIPDSHNVPFESDKFVQGVEEIVEDKREKVLVYGSGEGDQADAAQSKLMEAGFLSVYKFPGGMKEWKEQGYHVSGSAAAAH